MKIVSKAQLESKVRELGLSFMFKVASTGSEYITVDGQLYRVSDHCQPSHYQIRNYIDCHDYSQVFNLIEKKNAQKQIVNTWDEYLYDKQTDGFYLNENFIHESTKPINFF